MKSQIELLLFGRISRSFSITSEDIENIGLIRSGSIEAFSALFRKYYQPLYFFAGRFVRDPALAENIVQDIFVALWEKRDEIDIKISPKSYLYTSVKNRCLNAVKREGVMSSFDEQSETELDSGATGTAGLEREELNSEIHKVIDRLPEKSREIFMMCRFDGLSYKEIADIQNISINTVKTQLRRAMKFLAENLAHLRSVVIFVHFLAWHYLFHK